MCVFPGQYLDLRGIRSMILMHELNRHLGLTLLAIWSGTSSLLISYHLNFPGCRPKHPAMQCSDSVTNLNPNDLISTVKVFIAFFFSLPQYLSRQFSGHLTFGIHSGMSCNNHRYLEWPVLTGPLKRVSPVGIACTRGQTRDIKSGLNQGIIGLSCGKLM